MQLSLCQHSYTQKNGDEAGGTMDLSVSAIIQDASDSSKLSLEGLMLGHECHILLLQLAGVFLPCLQLQTTTKMHT